MIKSSGNSLLFFLALSSTLVVLGAFVVLNYKQIACNEIEAPIDAAAIVAAKDLSRLVIDEKDGCHFGVMGLIDGGQRKKDAKCVYGINTIRAAIKKNIAIAKKYHNQEKLAAAEKDLANLETDSLVLRRKIANAVVVGKFEDQDGNIVNLLDDTNNAFDSYALRRGKGKRSGLLQTVVVQSSSSITYFPPCLVKVAASEVSSSMLRGVEAVAKISAEPYKVNMPKNGVTSICYMMH